MNSDSDSYRLEISKSATRFLKRQEPAIRKRIAMALDGLTTQPLRGDICLLRGEVNQYRLRIGMYRALFHIDHQTRRIMIDAIGTRGDIYK
ncbi:MAG: type II toxin-antitoxin system RelE family toxin [Bacilli bacterium]